VVPSLKDSPQKQKEKEKDKDENQLAKSVKDSTKIAVEAQHGLISQVLKDIIFSMRPRVGESLGTEKISDVTDMAIG